VDQLGLTAGGQVSEAQLEVTFARALHPGSGQPLGRGWRSDAVTGYDLTISAPKSISVLWAIGGVTAATQVEAAHRGAYRGLFDHRTSRAGDPQLHTPAGAQQGVLRGRGVAHRRWARDLSPQKSSR
jgi:hypothetical protein